jgi:hypothetical protein
MKICTFHTTDRGDDLEMVPSVILAHGDTVDDLIPEISDSIAMEIVTANEEGNEIRFVNNHGNPIDTSVFGVVNAINEGTRCIVVKKSMPDGRTYENIYTIHSI